MNQKNISTTLLSILILILAIGCSRRSTEVEKSPDGALNVRTEISGDEAGPTKRFCVILIFENSRGKESRIQTGASNTMKWAIDWYDDDTLILYSSDIGTYAYDISEGMEISERKATEEELKTGREAYKSRYGRLPNH